MSDVEVDPKAGEEKCEEGKNAIPDVHLPKLIWAEIIPREQRPAPSVSSKTSHKGELGSGSCLSTVNKGRPMSSKEDLFKRTIIQTAAVQAVMDVNGIPDGKNISAKDWQNLFRKNGLEVSINQINHSFKRKEGNRRPLTSAMYMTLREALKDPSRNLILQRTVLSMERRRTQNKKIGNDYTPRNLTLISREETHKIEKVPRLSDVKNALETVVQWVNVKGTQREIEFFEEFSSRIESEDINETEQIRVENMVTATISENGDFTLNNIKI